ncbi:hypothetical protein FA13DRAFT_258736 [Coprinellus micaceus]|uniref:F-box domain-containing protein n=1 Tax=Coprinellus micaceus TaxID=71717 RepID=A0A4Y7TE87_COPMI|nr:hypothetical protein FA13DRAFT_258736 [Coprinellus micaceus]
MYSPSLSAHSRQVPRRVITPSDLDRYLNYYAPRIRSIKPPLPLYDEGPLTWVSSQALQALQAATDCQPGVLSPLLEEFDWTYLMFSALFDLEGYVGKDHMEGASLCMSLFLGQNLKHLTFSSFYDDPTHLTAIQSTAEKFPHLKSVSIALGNVAGSNGSRFLHTYLHASSWDFLETLDIGVDRPNTCLPYLPHPTTFHTIATLPRLKKLALNGLSNIALAPTSSSVKHRRLFSTLTDLELGMARMAEMISVLQLLPANHGLTSLTLGVKLTPSLEELKLAIDTIVALCNPRVLQNLELRVDMLSSGAVESLDLDEEAGLDISPLLVFQKLTKLTVHVDWNIQLTPGLLEQIPKAWPSLEELEFYSIATSTRIPLINHLQVLNLINRLPSLKELVIRFDATKVSGDEVVEGAPFPLKYLGVGDSPISSPSKVLRFLKANLPLIEPPDINWVMDWDTPVHRKRWESVRQSMGSTY